MNIHQLSRVRHYWNSNFVLKIDVANTVIYNRFIKIIEIIYINDNIFQFPKNDLNHNKIRALTKSINDNNVKIYKGQTRNFMTLLTTQNLKDFNKSTKKNKNENLPAYYCDLTKL